MLVDAHCHLTGHGLEPSEVDRQLDRARKVGVMGAVAVSTDLEDAYALMDLAEGRPNLALGCGVHPHEAKTWNAATRRELTQLLDHPRNYFVGETGLDWHYDFSPRQDQILAFRDQVALAREMDKPLMIHCRLAFDECLRILQEEGKGLVRGLFHCFSEDRSAAEQILDLGFYLSFSGILTFPKSQELQAVAAWAPLDRLLVETDAPYLAPVPHRGKKNEPALVVHVAEALARLKGLTRQQIETATSANLLALCGWLPQGGLPC